MPGESRSSPREIQNYLGRISGPLLDRVDLHVDVPAVKFREITAERTGETSAQIRERVVKARLRQQQRFADRKNITCNARMTTKELKAYCALEESTLELLKMAMDEMKLSARAYDRILKVARTIADLADFEKISAIMFPKPFNIVRWIGSCGRRQIRYSFVMVSSRFRIVRETIAQAATLCRFTSEGGLLAEIEPTFSASAVRSSK